MVNLYHGVTARALGAAIKPLLRRDVENVVIRMNREQAFALVAEITSAFGDDYKEIYLVLEPGAPIIYPREVFE